MLRISSERIKSDLTTTAINNTIVVTYMTDTHNDFRQPKQEPRSLSVRAISIFVLGVVAGFVFGLVIPSNLPGGQETGSRFASYSDGMLRASLVDAIDGTQNTGEVESSQISTYDVLNQYGKTPIDDEETYLDWMAENTAEAEEFLAARWALSRKFFSIF